MTDDVYRELCEGATVLVQRLAGCALANDERAQRAADAGNNLAAEVYRYRQDPEGVGLDALDAAYHAFMGQHSGNFTPMSPESVR